MVSKRKREPPCRISQLPDEVLGRILAELPIRNRIKAERVSKRWQMVGKTFAWSTTTALYTNTAEEEYMIEAVLNRCGDCSRIRGLYIFNTCNGRRTYDALRSVIDRCANLSSISLQSLSHSTPKLLRNSKDRVGKLLECARQSDTFAKRLKSLRLDSLNELAIDAVMELLGTLTQLETLRAEYDHKYTAALPFAPPMKKLRVLDIRDSDNRHLFSQSMLGSEANCLALAPNLRALRLIRWNFWGSHPQSDPIPLLHMKVLHHLRYLGVFNYATREYNLAAYTPATSQSAILHAVECMPQLRALELCGHGVAFEFLIQLPMRFKRALAASDGHGDGDGQHPLEHLKLNLGPDTPSFDVMNAIFSTPVMGKLVSVDLKACWPLEMDWSWIEDVALRGKLQYVSINTDGDSLQPHREALVKLACSIIKACPALRFCDVGTSTFTPTDIKLLTEAAKDAEERWMKSNSQPLPTITIGERRYAYDTATASWRTYLTSRISACAREET